MDQLNWQDDALCAQVGGDLFYPDTGGSSRDAKELCHSCPVIKECLDYAQRHLEQDEIWGGLTPRERLALRKGEAVAMVQSR